MMLRSHVHQLVTSTVLSSGVTATYLGTAPTGIDLVDPLGARVDPVDEARVGAVRRGAGVEPLGAEPRAVHRVVGHVDVRAVGGERRLDRRTARGARVAVDPEPRQVDRVVDGRVQLPVGPVRREGVACTSCSGRRRGRVGEATTDFGEMSPVIRSRRTSVVVSEAGRAGAVVGGWSARRRACRRWGPSGPGRPRGARRGVARSGRRLGRRRRP